MVVDGRAAGPLQDHSRTFTVQAPLEVVYVIPGEGDTDVPTGRADPCAVQPLRGAPHGSGGGSSPPVLQFAPPLEGRGEWLNTPPLPLHPGQPAAEYEILRAHSRRPDLGGGRRPPVGLQVGLLHHPARGHRPPATRGLHQGRAGHPIVVTFNRPMNRPSVEAGIVLNEVGAGPVAASFTWSERDAVVNPRTRRTPGPWRLVQHARPGRIERRRRWDHALRTPRRLRDNPGCPGTTPTLRFIAHSPPVSRVGTLFRESTI